MASDTEKAVNWFKNLMVLVLIGAGVLWLAIVNGWVTVASIPIEYVQYATAAPFALLGFVELFTKSSKDRQIETVFDALAVIGVIVAVVIVVLTFVVYAIPAFVVWIYIGLAFVWVIEWFRGP